MNKYIVWFSFLSFEPRRVCSEIGLTIPYYILIVINLMRTITLMTLGIMYMADEYGVFLLSTVLENTNVYIGFSNSCNVLSYG